MIRAVLDANIIVSSFPAESGTLAQLVARWQAGEFQIIMAEPLMDEIRGAWQKPYWLARFPPDQPERGERLLRQYAEWIQISEVIRGVAAHVADDVILSIAVSARADCLVTGDKKFRSLGSYAGVQLYSPAQFLDSLNE